MSRGYSTPAVVCLCALAFICGRFLDIIPGLPEAHSGFRSTPINQGRLVQRRAIEQRGPAAQRVLGANATSGASATQVQFATFDEAARHTQQVLRSPPVEPAESGNSFYTAQPFQVLSWYPRMVLYPGFLDQARCEHIIKMAKARLRPSSLALRKSDTADKIRDVRTSQGTFISRYDDPAGVLAWVEEKAAQLTSTPVSHGEPFNVLRYEPGQHYDSHYDIFEPESYGPQPSQRMATVLFYLSDVEEGGETVFLLEGEKGLARKPTIDYKSCDVGYKYKPRRGDALLFYSLHHNGTVDGRALHGGCPVVKGEKWVATKWIRDKCFMC
ncbi:hypothetical protein WJX81_000879 [Elliptochloris bilobata]|uniref:Fe2OG dioxygenase domain-containing protein n=1 Tax=Elliptochloris bilobata TaxID=381761 RepID=A0AAW1S848_9CHLO